MNDSPEEKLRLREEHKARHIALHNALDELVADFIEHTNIAPGSVTVMDLIKWSYEQTLSPAEKK